MQAIQEETVLQVVQTYDRPPSKENATHAANALEDKLTRAASAFSDRDQWPQPYERIQILFRLASLMHAEREQ